MLPSAGVFARWFAVVMQVGVKQVFQGPSGQIQLFFGNKADVPVGRLICAVPPQPVFAFQLGAVPPYIEPKKQVSHPQRGIGTWFQVHGEICIRQCPFTVLLLNIDLKWQFWLLTVSIERHIWKCASVCALAEQCSVLQ